MGPADPPPLHTALGAPPVPVDDTRDAAQWSLHDRTHLECALTYALKGGVDVERFEWEAYFFVPESLRLDPSTFSKDDIYSALQSYIRLAAPTDTLGGMVTEAGALADALRRGDEAVATRELRLLAGRIREASRRQFGELAADLARPERRDEALRQAERLAEHARAVAEAVREVTHRQRSVSSALATTIRWVDEDVSIVVESFLGHVVEALENHDAPRALRRQVAAGALAEARYRRLAGFESATPEQTDERAVEHLLFWRHTLKRFNESVLWLKNDIYAPGSWVIHALYAVAAGVAMFFALVAAMWNGPIPTRWTWVGLFGAVFAYALKDRIKAALQKQFERIVSRHLPDRRWRIEEPEGGQTVCVVDERSGFVPFEHLPEAVLTARRLTRRHPIEELARPETVLWHQKRVTVRGERMRAADPRLDGLREIFRLDVGRWLSHTDDPKDRVLFADPRKSKVRAVTGPRVYNLGVVYRFRHADADEPTWRRLRVVVSRKGILRVDAIV